MAPASGVTEAVGTMCTYDGDRVGDGERNVDRGRVIDGGIEGLVGSAYLSYTSLIS